jgi:transcriptional regulator with XRE-family HTH domain
MSQNLSQTELAALAEMKAEFDIVKTIPTIDPEMREVSAIIAHVRALLAEATQRDRVGVTELARRLGVSKSAVSHQLRSDADMRIGTAVLFARALGRKWEIDLVAEPGNPNARANFMVVPRPTATEIGKLVEAIS